MLQPAKRLHDLPGTSFGIGEGEGSLASQEALRSGEPGSAASAQHLFRPLREPEHAEEPVGLVRLEHALQLAALQRAERHIDRAGKLTRGNIEPLRERFEYPVGKARFDSGDALPSVGLKQVVCHMPIMACQMAARGRAARAAGDLPAESPAFGYDAGRMTTRRHFTEPTTHYWQRFVSEEELPESVRPGDGPWRYGYPARLPDGRFLVLPIRPLHSDPTKAVASIIGNQASLEVVETLGMMLARLLAPYSPEVVVGMPTLGLAFAPVVARELGLERIVPLGYSRKYWYEEDASATVRSITTPGEAKRVYLDPNLVPLLSGHRVALVDDAVSSGATLDAPWQLVEALGAEVIACGVVMRQSDRWVATLGAERAAKVVGVFDTPLLTARSDGWVRL